MALNVLDLSSYQSGLNLDAISYDGVLIKATEGNDYVNPHCDIHYQQAKAAGKKRGIYHFYDFNVDPVTQADYLADNTVGYQHDAIFVLDWEGSGVANTGDALRFLQRLEARIGYKPALYMSEWVENHYDWSDVVAGDYSLWLAKYSDYEIDNNYDMSGAGTAPSVVHWPFYFMWQWTSKGHLNGYAGDLDCDIAYLTQEQWDKYAGVPPAPAPVDPPVVTPPAPVAEPSEPPAPSQPTPPPPQAGPDSTPGSPAADDTPAVPPVTTPPQPPQAPPLSRYYPFIEKLLLWIWNLIKRKKEK